MISDRIKDYAKTRDAAIEKKRGYFCTDLTTFLEVLEKKGMVEVGWRESCGKTDSTAHIKTEWDKVVKFMEKEGVVLKQERLGVGNGWASKSKGFWNAINYKLEAVCDNTTKITAKK